MRLGRFSPAIRNLPRRTGAVAAVMLGVVGLATSAGVAGAAPHPTAKQAEARLKKLTTKEDWLIQQYDQVSQEMSAARQRLTVIGGAVARDQRAVQGMRTQIAQLASSVYEDGSMTSVAALLTSSNPQALLSQSAILTHLSANNQAQLEQFLATDRQLTGAQQMAKRAEQAIAGLKSQLAGQKTALGKVIAQQKTLLNSLTQQQLQQQLGGGGVIGGGGTYHGPTNTQAGKAVAFAYAQLGKPYVWGATGPGSYDCSGLVQAAWAAAGVSIPRITYEQWAALPHVPMSAIQPGDLIFFNAEGHVAIYVGNNILIDAPQPGQVVEKVSLSSSWYASTVDGAARP